MTISLAAVFIPLWFMTGLCGRIFREFSITIIVSIFFAERHRVVTLTAADVLALAAGRGAAQETWWSG